MSNRIDVWGLLPLVQELGAWRVSSKCGDLSAWWQPLRVDGNICPVCALARILGTPGAEDLHSQISKALISMEVSAAVRDQMMEIASAADNPKHPRRAELEALLVI